MKRRYHKDVHYICKLSGIKKIEKVYGKLKNYDVVLTDERKKHIIERRGKDSLFILANLVNVIENYDHILASENNCIKYIKMSEDNYALVIKLSLDNINEANSILSAMKINTKRAIKYASKDRVIESRIW